MRGIKQVDIRLLLTDGHVWHHQCLAKVFKALKVLMTSIRVRKTC